MGSYLLDSPIHDHCGITGVYSYSNSNVTTQIVQILEALQHRGQESVGLAVDGNPTYTRDGLVYNALLEDGKKIDQIKGHAGIGHVRYSTSGKSGVIGNFHPIPINSKIKFSIAHNGTIPNKEDIERELKERGLVLPEIPGGRTDTELAGYLIGELFSESHDWVTTFEKFTEIKNGSFCFTILTEKGDVIAARDDRGYKPLCYGYHDETHSYVIASEDHALKTIDAKKIDDVKPGELIILDKDGPRIKTFSKNVVYTLDPFEITYFAKEDSVIDGIEVGGTRKNIGREMYKKFSISADVVVPIPESAYHAAEGVSLESGIPLTHAIRKDRYMRSFIEPNDERRKYITKGLYVINSLVRGKEVLLVDDSIIRLTSSRKYTGLVSNAGATKISLFSYFPPIRFPCYMGIDFPTQEELIAHRLAANESDLEKIGEKVAGELGIAFVGYMDPATLSKAIGLPLSSFCFACVTGDYSRLNFSPKFRTREEMKGE